MINRVSPERITCDTVKPFVSTLNANVHVIHAAAVKNPHNTGNGRNEPKLANLKTLANTIKHPEINNDIPLKNENVVKNISSLSVSDTLGS